MTDSKISRAMNRGSKRKRGGGFLPIANSIVGFFPAARLLLAAGAITSKPGLVAGNE